MHGIVQLRSDFLTNFGFSIKARKCTSRVCQAWLQVVRRCNVESPPAVWICRPPSGIVVVAANIMFQAILGPIGAQIEPLQLATSSAKAKTIIRITFRIHAPAFAHLQKNLHTFTSGSWWTTEKLYNNQLLRPQPSSWNLTFCGISGVKHTMICCGSTRYKSPRGTILGDLRCARSRHFECPCQTIQEYNTTNNLSEHQRFLASRPSRTFH